MKFTFAPESRPIPGFTIKRAIYRGGFGEVYYAVSDAGREVALKLLQHNTEVELRGVQQCLNLSHPHLVTIFDILKDKDGDQWIMMEYISGPTLEATLRRHPQGMPVEAVRKWLSGLAEGIDFLHRRGLVHRDLKPANLFLQEGIVKIGDVGLSKFISQSQRSAQTQSVGTVYYMAPEVANGSYGREVDVYAVGVMLYEMLTGDVPFDGESTGEILMKHLTATPDLSKLPPRLRSVIGKALHKKPEQRDASVGELAQAFETAILGRVDSAAETPLPSPVEAVQRRFENSAQTTLPDWGKKWSRRELIWLGVMVILISALSVLVLQEVPFDGVGTLAFVLLAVAGVRLFWAQAEPVVPKRQVIPSPSPPAAEISQTANRHHRLAGILGMACLVGPVTVLLSLLLAFIKPSLFMVERGTIVQPVLLGLFILSAITAGWGITLIRWMQSNSPQARVSRMTMGLVGLAVGAVVFHLDQTLFVDLPTKGENRAVGALKQIGDHLLIVEGQGPTLPGYALFFGALFGLRNWARITSPSRPDRVSAWSVGKTIFLAWLIVLFLAFPLAWGLAWAAVIACSAQLASPWRGKREEPGVRNSNRLL